MTFGDALMSIFAVVIPLIVPGIFFMKMHDWGNILLSGSRIMLWSMGSITLVLTAGLYMNIAIPTTFLVVSIFGIAYALYTRRLFTRQALWHLLAIAIPVLLLTTLFAIPFLFVHDGLPSGDVQKTIIWANETLRTHTLPDYQKAIDLLNRDPVDFYTPGLHAVSALVLYLSPVPLLSIGLFSILLAVCVGWIAASIAKELFDRHVHIAPPILAAVFTLTQLRFLRYIREPGYHFQNIVGELLLFGMILLVIRFIRKGERQDALLFLVCACALFLSHQFSAFIAAFVISAMGVACAIVFRSKIIRAIHVRKDLVAALLVVCAGATVLLFSLGLGRKLSAIFTNTPHLGSLLLPLTQYPSLMGEFWFFSGLAGMLLMVVELRRKDSHFRQVFVFVFATFALFMLSRGPSIGIDIPPVRALFYLAVPFSVAAAYLFGKLFYVVTYAYDGSLRQVARVGILLAIGIAVSSSTTSAFSTLSHTVRTNSTLTGEQLGLIGFMKNSLPKENPPAILIDDFNRKSASWLVLTDAPMYTRIAADLERQMDEAWQSKLRSTIYLRQLDYEKIFALGSIPHISSLFEKHNIGYVTGIDNSSKDAFAHNLLMNPIAVADDISVYEVQRAREACTSMECTFLLRPATLANDIGDLMDTFENLQASIRTPRLSEPLAEGRVTYRKATAPIIPLSFNVGDYVRVLWDPNGVGKPETSLTFMLWLTNPVEGLSLRTSTGEDFALPYTDRITVELSSDVVQITDKGFVLLSLINPRGEAVPIDLISLGLSLVP